MKRKCELCMNLRLVFPRVLSVSEKNVSIATSGL